jgi:hypothetical protein
MIHVKKTIALSLVATLVIGAIIELLYTKKLSEYLISSAGLIIGYYFGRGSVEKSI